MACFGRGYAAFFHERYEFEYVPAIGIDSMGGGAPLGRQMSDKGIEVRVVTQEAPVSEAVISEQ